MSDLEELRSSQAARSEAANNGAETEEEEDGLLDAVGEAVKNAGEKAPEALAAPLDERVDRAAEEVRRQLDESLEQGLFQRFLLQAIPGWLLALGIAFAVKTAPWVRRGRARLRDAVRSRTNTTGVLGAISTGAVWHMLPLLCGGAVVLLWPLPFDMSPGGTRLFLACAIPVLIAGVL